MFNICCHGNRYQISRETLASAVKVAWQIAKDLGMLDPARCTFSWAEFRADQRGGNWFWAPSDQMDALGSCSHFMPYDEIDPLHGRIRLNDKLSKAQAAHVFFHELAHRAMLSPQYEDLSEPGWENLDPCVFQELIAICVGEICRFVRNY